MVLCSISAGILQKAFDIVAYCAAFPAGLGVLLLLQLVSLLVLRIVMLLLLIQLLILDHNQLFHLMLHPLQKMLNGEDRLARE
jgi:hypothetical protein